jgi:AcrR family transcriptional regulator
MQVEKARRSNRDRTEATRGQLIAAARKLFTEKSYAETSTPDIAAAAGVTRGALYHHFTDKQALFRAVVEHEAEAVAGEIERAFGPASAPAFTPGTMSARGALLAGSDAYFEAMRKPGRTRLLLLDGPAVLGRDVLDEIDSRHGNRTLHEALAEMMVTGEMRRLPLDALTELLGAAFDRAALAIEAGAPAETYREPLVALIDGLAVSPSPDG